VCGPCLLDRDCRSRMPAATGKGAAVPAAIALEPIDYPSSADTPCSRTMATSAIVENVERPDRHRASGSRTCMINSAPGLNGSPR
jgi:hypothetical protein